MDETNLFLISATWGSEQPASIFPGEVPLPPIQEESLQMQSAIASKMATFYFFHQT